jgi:hypothetical protein
MTSPLNSPYTFRLNALVALPRGMSESEAQRYLASGELPDFSRPPSDQPLTTDIDRPDVDVLSDQDVRLLLSGQRSSAVVASLVAESEQTSRSHYSDELDDDEIYDCGCTGDGVDKTVQTGTELSPLSSSQRIETPAPVGELPTETETDE